LPYQPYSKGKRRRIALPVLPWTTNEEELVYQALPKGKMKKKRFTRPSLDQERRRICLPGFFQRKNEEELLYQTSSKRKTKNCSTRLHLEEK